MPRLLSIRLLSRTVLLGLFLLFLFYVASGLAIGISVRRYCREAVSDYGGSCVDALSAVLSDEGRGFRERNSAVWALGQLGDSRALLPLEQYYTGQIPDRESLERELSQYELKKAVNLAGGGFNLTAWIWRWLLL